MSESQKKLWEDPIYRKKISDAIKEFYIDPTNHPNYGKHLSEETRNKIGKANGKIVLQFNINGEYVAEYISGTEAERQTGILQVNISKCCRKLNRTAGGYFWIYKQDYNPNVQIFDQIKQERIYVRSEKTAAIYDIPVVQLSLDDVFINEFKSIAEAKRQTGCIHISECCNSIRRQDCGYKWMRKSDWNKLQLTIQNELEEADELQVI